MENIYRDIQGLLSKFSTISLAEMDDVKLMRRTDTKFLIPLTQLTTLLQQLQRSYRVLKINENLFMTYSSLYFDTKNNTFYMDHHNGKGHRIKVRQRKYVESNLCFLEVKHKDVKGLTNKYREPTGTIEPRLSPSSIDFISNIRKRHDVLEARLWTNFNRITLVSIKDRERVTIDLNLGYHFHAATKEYPNMVIIEVKKEEKNRNSKIIQDLKILKQYPYSMSKYCIGMVSLYGHLKYNIFKKNLLKINNMNN